jgi:hypothetical protein
LRLSGEDFAALERWVIEKREDVEAKVRAIRNAVAHAGALRLSGDDVSLARTNETTWLTIKN